MTRRELWEQVPEDLYSVLGVDPLAQPQEITDAWRTSAKREHPDLGGDQARFRAVNIAYLVLSDQEARTRYDRARQRATIPPAPPDDVPVVPPAHRSPAPWMVWAAALLAVAAVLLSYAWPVFTIVTGVVVGAIVTVGYVRLIRLVNGRSHGH